MKNHGLNVYETSNKQFDTVLVFLKYEQHLFPQRFVHNQTPIFHRQVVAEQYVLRNTKSGVL
jgi:hypothetical protein